MTLPDTKAVSLLQRVIFPRPGEPLDVRSLYLVESDRNESRAHAPDRTSVRLGAESQVSFATYFNAFAASYWRRWTTLTSVVLRVELAAVNGGGTEAAGARVDLYRSKIDGARIAIGGDLVTPDADGHFTMAGLPPDMPLSVLSVGQEQQYTRESEWPDKLTLEPGETRDIGTATVDRAGLKLKGRTLDAKRNVLAGCTVIDVTSDRCAVSDAEGAFELSGLPYKGAGRWLLAMHPDKPLFCIEANADPTVDRALDLVLEPLGSVCGRLLDTEGEPLVEWRVGVQASGTMVVGERQYADAAQRGARVQTWAETDANGAWCVDGIVCGATYWVSSYDAEVAQGRPKRFWHDTFAPRAVETVDFGDVTVK